ncbi:ABC transporter permease [Adhaeribacter soli]|uniref:ABC transporter permease n=1 Tax=Adhaeribacter soli TaxID=2607655 RepID=A0A5N1IK59_9BACT|nr:ABC transporter permease [Adhaeribacter soli]KAA9325034.1 ABC transporter permease [Adhaeribacter soli]
MLKFAAKRLLMLLPAIWLLGSAVFLLSRSVPGSAAEMQAEETAQNAISNAKAEARKRVQAQMLQRTGQDLPLFYFRIGSAAEPDTLYKIFPVTEQQTLKELVLTYGNWPEIAAYYKTVQKLKEAVAVSEVPVTVKKDLNFYANALLKESQAGKINRTFLELKSAALSSPETKVQNAVASAEVAFQQIESSQTPALNYSPKIFWYGTQNQYHRWLRNLVQGDLGESYRDARPVSEIISEALSITGWLALVSFLLICFLAPAIAIVLSLKSSNSFRGALLNLLYVLESLPLFVIGLGALALVSYLGWLTDFPEEVALLSATFCLVLVNLPYLVGQSYSALQKEMSQQYMLTARAKGFSEQQALVRHALRNSLLPVITALSDFFPALLAGALVLEVIFSLPGTGQLLVSSVLARDYEVVTGLVLLVGLVKILSHLLADLLYAFTDPRIRFSS